MCDMGGIRERYDMKLVSERTGMVFTCEVTVGHTGYIWALPLVNGELAANVESVKYTEETLPQDISDKIKILRWAPPADASCGLDGVIGEVGVRVGTRRFLIV